jgi:SMODS and SLOG-associating 2TM effector domain 1
LAIVLGVMSAVLAVFSALSFVSAWAAVIATVITSISAHVKNQRYQVLIGLYQATATRLQLLIDGWDDSGKTDADRVERDAFIQRCEDTLAMENTGWVAQWTEQPKHELPPPAPDK